mmetsp:Transcript_40962/g.65867  ORF Transcript_40962/g.65867 Transcript_40962/m.65867 type:complete len:250 (-) Transcript_40962:582-1331(-)
MHVDGLPLLPPLCDDALPLLCEVDLSRPVLWPFALLILCVVLLPPLSVNQPIAAFPALIPLALPAFCVVFALLPEVCAFSLPLPPPLYAPSPPLALSIAPSLCESRPVYVYVLPPVFSISPPLPPTQYDDVPPLRALYRPYPFAFSPIPRSPIEYVVVLPRSSLSRHRSPAAPLPIPLENTSFFAIWRVADIQLCRTSVSHRRSSVFHRTLVCSPGIRHRRPTHPWSSWVASTSISCPSPRSVLSCAAL